MAIKISKKLIEKAFCNSYHVPEIKNYYIKKIIKINLIFFISIYRKIICLIKDFLLIFVLIFCKEKKIKNSPIKINLPEIKNKIKDFDQNGWCYIENFMDEKNYNNIKINWPKNFFLKSRDNPIKYFNIGLEYIKAHPKIYLDKDKQILSLYPYIKNYYEFLQSNQIDNLIKSLIPKKKNYETVSIACTTCYPGSFLVPHIDTVAIENQYEETINCIHFIDGNDNDVEFSGGTGIYEDNEFKKRIFIPKSLKNSVLIYNSKKLFYHGFDFIKKKNYRKAIAFQLFLSE